MNSFRRIVILSILFVAAGCLGANPAAAKWKYLRSGNAADAVVTPKGGFALMGGGGHQEEAFQFLCDRANGGDFLVLRASGDDDYIKQVNDEMLKTCPLNSAATILFTDRDEDADDPKIVDIIAHAESIFFAGGDQSNYVRFWQDTPIEKALNDHIAAGKPIGGSSAGLAILGEFSFSSMIDTIHSPEALANPYGNEVTLTRDFLKIPLLADVITDTHFVKRDRMGRLLVFLSRILQDDWAPRARGIALEENASFLLELDGTGVVAGVGPAYFLETSAKPTQCAYRKPLSMDGIKVHRVPKGMRFNVKTWKGEGGDDYVLNVKDGQVSAVGSTHGIY